MEIFRVSLRSDNVACHEIGSTRRCFSKNAKRIDVVSFEILKDKIAGILGKLNKLGYAIQPGRMHA